MRLPYGSFEPSGDECRERAARVIFVFAGSGVGSHAEAQPLLQSGPVAVQLVFLDCLAGRGQFTSRLVGFAVGPK